MKIVKVTAVALSLLLCSISQAAITAPKCIEAGQLAVAHSDEPATWTVFPVKYQTDIYIADGGMTCIFASPVKGEITIMAATVEDGKAVISQHTLYNGLPNPEGDETTPVPDPPKPAPEPEPETVATIVKNADVDATAEEFDALAAAFETAVSGIDRGTIRTPAGARETFRAVWIRQAATVNPDAIATFSALLATLGEKVDNSTLATVKADYTAIINALKERSEATKKTAKEEDAKTGQPETAKPTTTSSCPNGQCPANGNGYYWRFR